jgi:hypothetical protein
MFLFQKLWIKKHKKHLILILFVLILTNFITFAMTSGVWVFKYIEAEHRAEACLPLQPKIPTQKILISNL